MKPKVYIETTVASYFTAGVSRDLVVAAHQLTAEWWNRHRQRFPLLCIGLGSWEAGRGEADMAARRLMQLRQIPVLELTKEASSLAKEFVDAGLLPRKAVGDSLHVALATLHGMDFLLTWNCRHIANAEIVRGHDSFVSEIWI